MNQYQKEFSFMNAGIQYNNGEMIVNRNNLRQGVVLESLVDDAGNTERVKIQYDDGISEWISSGSVSKLLLETDPKPQTNNLNEDWNLT
jgi:hypothetical protein